MRVFARIHSHGGHGSGMSDYVTYDAGGQAHYHLVPILFTFVLLTAGVVCVWAMIIKPDFTKRPVPAGCFITAGAVFVLVVLTCCILLRYPAFGW